MDTRTQDRVEEWDARSFSGGFDGLRELADDEFTGAVESAGRHLFMLNGRIVGVFDGDLDDFEDASGTTYSAPDPALVMLCTMWETGGETKAKYYTNDTPISEVDDTLTSGSFTGYLELSENVLSGDYYVCYYGGRSLPVAWVGNSEQLLTGDEAFERADDEVGIYEVRDVDLEVVELPEPEPDPEPEPESDHGAGGAAVAGSAAAGDTDDGAGDTSESSTAESSTARARGGSVSDETTADSAPTDDEGATALGPGDASTGATANDAIERTDATASAEGADTSTRPDTERERSRAPTDEARRRNDDRTTGDGVSGERNDTGASGQNQDPTSDADIDATPEDVVAAPPADDDRGSTAAGEAAERARSGRSRRDQPSTGRGAGTNGPDARSDERGAVGDRGDPLAETSAPADDSDPRFEKEAAWRETTTIPSIDPDQSAEAEESHGPTGSAVHEGGDRRRDAGGGAPTGSNGRGGRASGRGSSARDAPGAGGTGAGGGSEPLEREMLEREDKIDRLQQRVSNLESERDELRAECERLRSEAEDSADVDALAEERDRLQSENEQLRERAENLQHQVDSLESEIERLESALEEARAAAPEDDGPDAARELSPAAALSGTNLFVRYASKGEDTLADAHSGTATRDDVNDNLRLEHHTSFDADDVAVGDVPYEQFLRESIEFGFVDWAVRTLLFEIRETGNQDQLRDLYDTLPEVDRAELDGTVELERGEDEETPAEINFDVVLRNRMGAPLVVANVNDSRDAATEGMMVQLNEDAGAVKERHDEFVGAFMVTTSFFEPGALETADEATSGSFLSRDSRKSFVKLSRKRGYHLCLVETRDGNFHVNVPEL